MIQNQYNKRLTIDEELDDYESKIRMIKQYLDGIDLSKLDDRINYKPTAKGGTMPMVIASKEQIAKSFMDMMEKLPKLFNQLDELRNKYAEKQMLGRGKIETKNTAMDFLHQADNMNK